MGLRAIAAALKAKYRPVFRGDIDREAEKFTLFAKHARATANEITGAHRVDETGAGRAIASLTKGKGE